jgi:hypothetical protein
MQESREVSAADFQFTQSALTFYIEAARHALHVANLPQFHACIRAVEWHRDYPSEDTYDLMVEQYWMLRGNEHLYNRAFAAIKEFYHGLCFVLESAVDGVEGVSMSDVFAFQEAKWYAARAVGADPYDVQRAEDAWQNGLFQEVFPDELITRRGRSGLARHSRRALGGPICLGNQEMIIVELESRKRDDAHSGPSQRFHQLCGDMILTEYMAEYILDGCCPGILHCEFQQGSADPSVPACIADVCAG